MNTPKPTRDEQATTIARPFTDELTRAFTDHPDFAKIIGVATGAFVRHALPAQPREVLTDEEIGRIALDLYPVTRDRDQHVDSETRRYGALRAMKHLRDKGYLSPAPVPGYAVTVDKLMEVVEPWYFALTDGTRECEGFSAAEQKEIADLRTRFTKLLK